MSLQLGYVIQFNGIASYPSWTIVCCPQQVKGNPRRLLCGSKKPDKQRQRVPLKSAHLTALCLSVEGVWSLGIQVVLLVPVPKGLGGNQWYRGLAGEVGSRSLKPRPGS